MKIFRPGDELDKLTKWNDFLRYCAESNRPADSLWPLTLFVVGALLLIMAALMLMAGQWSPGQQETVANEYKASLHAAEVVAVDKPSIEIVP